MLLDGVSSYTEFSSRRAFIPASLDILMIFPLYFLIKKKFKEAIILGILISTFHYFSFILLFLFFTSYLITNAQEKLNVLSKNYFLFISLVFLLVSISIVTLNNLYISESIDSALRVLIFERINSEWNLLPIVSIGTSIASFFNENPIYLSYNISTFNFSLQKLDPTFASPTLGSFRDYSIFPVEYMMVNIFGIYASRKKQISLLSNTIVIAFFQHLYLGFYKPFFLGSFAILSMASFWIFNPSLFISNLIFNF